LSRQYVHLTTNLQRAEKVAIRRKQEIVILQVRADEMVKAGYVFHQAEEEHFLVKNVPSVYIDFPSDDT